MSWKSNYWGSVQVYATQSKMNEEIAIDWLSKASRYPYDDFYLREFKQFMDDLPKVVQRRILSNPKIRNLIKKIKVKLQTM